MNDPNDPVICVFGATGCGKSTFCNLLIGNDPRKNNGFFYAASSETSVTEKVERKNNLTWFDGEGTLTIIDCPGLSDSEGRDQ